MPPTLESSRTSSETRLRFAWDHCPAGRSNGSWTSVSLLTAWCFTYDFLVVLSSTRCRFPTPGEPKQLQSNTELPPCVTVRGVGQGFVFSGCLCLMASHNIIPKQPWFMYMLLSTLESTFLVFLISTGVRHGVQAWKPSVLLCVLLCKLKPQCLQPPRPDVGYLQSFKGFWPPVSSRIW